MDKKLLNTMFENLLHIGNKTNFWNAKMKPYIYGSVNGIHVINLVKTAEKMTAVKEDLEKLTGEGKKILFVGTRLQAKDAVAKLAESTGNYHVTDKWVPGLLTNFKTIKRRIATYVQLLKDSESGAFDVLTKKEKAAKMLELEKLDKAYSGVKEMKRLPDIIFVIDGVYEEQAIKEANNLDIPVYAILNTNGDDTVVNNFIIANTNSVKSIEYIISELKDSIKVVKSSPASKARVKKIVHTPSEIKKVTVKKANPEKQVDKKKEEEKVEKKTEKTPNKKQEETEKKKVEETPKKKVEETPKKKVAPKKTSSSESTEEKTKKEEK